jgi:hypothetical protein
MKIQNATIAGLPVKRVRELLRFIGDRAYVPEVIAERFFRDDDVEGARHILSALVAEGLLENERDRYWVTEQGRRLRVASFLPRINRAKADRVISGLLDRAAAINADDKRDFRIAAIFVFGSYLTDSDDLGDVDIAVEFEYRQRGVREREAWKALQGRDRYLHHGAGDGEASLVEMGVPYRKIFPT